MLDVNAFDSMKIGLASPQKIREWSHGEVTKPETINYRTLKPEKDGLFCERIFGPQKDWECHCGKYKRIRNKGVICDKCGVEVTRAKVRRERMGHIELASPVSHIWYFKGIPSRMGLILDISPKSLERVLYFVAYIVINPGTAQTDRVEKEMLDFENELAAKLATYEYFDDIDIARIRRRLGREIADAVEARRTEFEMLVQAVTALPEEERKPKNYLAAKQQKLKAIEDEISTLLTNVAANGGKTKGGQNAQKLWNRLVSLSPDMKKLFEANKEWLFFITKKVAKGELEKKIEEYREALESTEFNDAENDVEAVAPEQFEAVENNIQTILKNALEETNDKELKGEVPALWTRMLDLSDSMAALLQANEQWQYCVTDEVVSKALLKEVEQYEALLQQQADHQESLPDEPTRLEMLRGEMLSLLSNAVTSRLGDIHQKFGDGLREKSLLTEEEYREAVQVFGEGSFDAKIGAEAIKELLQAIDLEALNRSLRDELMNSTGQRRVRAVRRLEVVEAFRQSGNRPEWMIMDCIPVIPPELRPMVQLDGGRFATSDLNDLYRRVINRNNRLKRLLELRAPEIIVRNEKRMLQEAVDALIDNGRRGRPVTGPGNRPLKSLSDLLKGKQGRFRQNLLGKRVDYSGRSVIVVGPELKMHQCGLPKEMALELFKPFVMKELVSRGMANNIKNAKKKVEKASPEVWDVLEEVIHEHPVLLNRAPTLHRLGIQAFEPILWEGRAIKLHPLVCAAYNADFDGDQMACHLPLSVEAQAEARTLMLSVNNILSTKDGKPVAVPSQDMVLGAYYLTIDKSESYPEDKQLVPAYRFAAADENARAKMYALPTYTGYDEAMMAYDQGYVTLQDYIYVRLPKHGEGETGYELVLTTCGRLIFNMELPSKLRFYNETERGLELGILMDKKRLAKLVDDCFHTYNMSRTAELLDRVKTLGFHYARKAGMTVGIADIRVPAAKADILAAADKQVEKVSNLYKRGFITEQERYRKTIEIWNQATEDVTQVMMEGMDKFNPLTMMAQSGARGNTQQIRQLAGMRGLMADPSGRIIDLPIKANFREGLTVLDYFTSSHGARKGLADTALRTADSGYLTRRLVDVSQDVIVREEDCDVITFELHKLIARMQAAYLRRMLKENEGAVLAADILEADGEAVRYQKEAKLTEGICRDLIAMGRDVVSVVTKDGAKESLALKTKIDPGVDIMLAKLHERADHENWTLAEPLIDKEGKTVADTGTKVDAALLLKALQSGAVLLRVRLNEMDFIEVEAIKDGKAVIEPLNERLIGRVAAEDLQDDKGNMIVHCNEEINETTAQEIAKYYDRVKIRSILTCKSPHGVCCKCYGRSLGSGRTVEKGEAVGIIAAQSIGEPGTQLTMRTFHTGGVASDEDITQGLPRVEELFEARKPKRYAVISDIAGMATVAKSETNADINIVTVTGVDAEGNETVWEKIIPYGLNLVSPLATYLEDVKQGLNPDPVEIAKGDRLTEGSINPHDILRILGVHATQKYIVYEVQKVYRSQGVEINDKHIEVIVRQMLHKVKIEESGDSSWLPGESIEMRDFLRENERLRNEGMEPAEGKFVLLGITKAALATDSFLSAASFQETTRVLTDAAIKGKQDKLIGLKENVIIGKLIPAGTGMKEYRSIRVEKEEPEEPAPEQVAEPSTEAPKAKKETKAKKDAKEETKAEAKQESADEDIPTAEKIN